MAYKGLLQKVEEYVYALPPAFKKEKEILLFLSPSLLEELEEEALKQLIEASSLPGVISPVCAMPDAHVGYGFPVGGVLATDPGGGIISPGCIGYDINCGVHLVKTSLLKKEIEHKIPKIIQKFYEKIPAGVGSEGKRKLSKKEIEEVLQKGAKWAIEKGYGEEEDLEYIEDKGCMEEVDIEAISEEAKERGRKELGSLGSGNHFVEILYVEEIYEKEYASSLDIEEEKIFLLVHSGSRGLGHQVCTDYLEIASRVKNRYKLSFPNKNLAYLPFSSREGKTYYSAMKGASNFAYANREILGALAAEALKEALGVSWSSLGYELFYDHTHNIARLEEHRVKKKKRKVLIHRKGATRSFPPYSLHLPSKFQPMGQPVILPGDMGRFSYVLLGEEGALQRSWGSSPHGAGRRLSRKKAKELIKKEGKKKYLKDIQVIAKDKDTIWEEIPAAYKDISEVIEVVKELKIARPFFRLKPLGTLKG